MRSALRGVLVGIAVLAIAAALLDRTGAAAVALPRADGPGPWHVARATGFAAFVALALDVAIGLLTSTGAADRWLPRGHAVDLHRWLSPIALALVLGHGAALLGDGFIRFDALDLVVPFVSPYRPIAVGLGVIAGYLAIVVHASFGLRRRLGSRAWRRLHYLSFVAFAAAAVHALLAGSDAARAWALVVVAAPTAVVIALVVTRVRAAIAAPRARRARGPA